MLHTEVQLCSPEKPWRGPGAGLVRAWCGPGAGHCHRGADAEVSVNVNPVASGGLLHSILLSAQDCSTQSCREHRIALMQHQQLGLGAVLARAQPCDGAGPAVEFPGRHRCSAGEPGRATVTFLGGRCRRCTLLSVSGRCCVKEPHFPEKLLRSRTYEQAARRPARPL